MPRFWPNLSEHGSRSSDTASERTLCPQDILLVLSLNPVEFGSSAAPLARVQNGRADALFRT